MELNDKVNDWLRHGKRGFSSDAIVTVLTGLNLCKPWESHAPRDPSDFGRCLGLLVMVPELRSDLHKMKEVSPIWNQVITHWDELERLYYKECETGTCPELYDKMKSIGC